MAGWYTDRTSVRISLVTSIVFGMCGFLLVSAVRASVFQSRPSWPSASHSSWARLRSTQSWCFIRARICSAARSRRRTLLNLGSFLGNTIAVQMIAKVGYYAHAVLLAILHLPLAIGLAAPAVPTASETPETRERGHFRDLLKNGDFSRMPCGDSPWSFLMAAGAPSSPNM